MLGDRTSSCLKSVRLRRKNTIVGVLAILNLIRPSVSKSTFSGRNDMFVKVFKKDVEEKVT